MLKLRDVTAGYGKSEVLRGVSLEVHAGEVVTLVGANGAGKTTTLKTLCGLVKARSGSIEFDSLNLTSHAPHEIVELGITMIPEGRQLFPFLTVEENLLMGAYKTSARPFHKERMEKVLEIFPRVKERLAQLAGSLSGGEQQMVAIARGMMADPRLLVFDEPSLGLSPLLVDQMFDVVRTVADQGTTVLLVEQNVFHTLQIADRGYVLENGCITLSGTGRELLDNPHVRRAYLGH
ncbi:branched-chain amino acid ABC transporter ATP-binding protein [Malikia spinosa]|jgi:branched-chain amino acid transport system ATP-binding protein|uniref:Branched-chain amino acid ABC transporter ATP-binding protein n=1 Tax=Malikia spinosa TaxID=86180 RepID=A0A2S9KF97_9BURK|nr:ABC transporter ATP-binding protein [Malikia spinosa]MCX7251031.1 ABC transporter ATP-binding protein [Burkholderiales bacterium]PRD69055.1 branched-chain amino acid ABC transporter ATP-binding protein [Malikia spinosa]